MLLEWDGSLEIGHALIDAQHKSLVDLINRLHAGRATGMEEEGLRLVLMDLYKYTLFHFGQEESLMRQAGYPELAGHKAEHDAFVARLDQLAARARAGDEHLGADTFNWLVGWLLDHISLRDRKLSACLGA